MANPKKIEEIEKIIKDNCDRHFENGMAWQEINYGVIARQICQLFEPEIKPDDTAPWYDRAGETVMDIPEKARERLCQIIDSGMSIGDIADQILMEVAPLIEHQAREKLIGEIEKELLGIDYEGLKIKVTPDIALKVWQALKSSGE